MMKKLFLIVFFALLIIIPSVYSLKATLGNARAVIEVNASPESPFILDRVVIVPNKNSIPVKVSLSVDKKDERFINIIDKELVIQPNETQRARYTLTMDRGGNFNFKINVGFESADPNVKESKVGLAATLIVNSNGPIIEDPIPEEEVIEEEPPALDATPENINPSNQTVSVRMGGSFNQEEKEEEANSFKPLVGILIVIIIVGLGLVVFFIVKKLK